VANEPEHRMLFDVRGRRKRVIQVIYVILAIIMAASLIVIGLPGNLNPFGNTGNSGNTDAAKLNVERADKLQTKFEQQPNNEQVAVELIRARFSAGQSLYATDPDTQQTSITDEATTQFDMAAETWNKYLKLSKDDPDPTVAQLMANMLFTLSQGSTVAQFQNNIKDAAKAQEFVAEDAVKTQEKGGSSASNQLTTLAIYQLYAQDYAGAEKTLDRALASTDDKDDQKQIKQTFKSTKKDAQRVGKLIDKAIKQAQKSGDESLKNPLGSLGTGDTLNGASGSPTTP